MNSYNKGQQRWFNLFPELTNYSDKNNENKF